MPSRINPARLRGASESLSAWDGSDPAGLTLRVACDTDLPTTIRLIRYIPLLAGRGASVLVVCAPAFGRVLGRVRGVGVYAPVQPIPPADVATSLGRLPELFFTTPATVPTYAAYLRADGPAVAAWRGQFNHIREPAKKLVGLSLPGHASELADGFQALRAIFDTCDATVAEIAPEDRPVDRPASRIARPTFRFDDVADAAGLMTQLDLFITSDATQAHLAAALGKPVWHVAVRSAATCSMIDDETAWYPALRHFGHAADESWGSTVKALANAYRQFISTTPRLAA